MGQKLNNVIKVFFATLAALIVLGPIVYIVITSLRTSTGIWTLSAYPRALNSEFVHDAWNSVMVAGGIVLGALICSLGLAYAMNRLKEWYTNGLFVLVLGGLAVPINAGLIPLYSLSYKLGLYNHLIAIIFPGIAYALPISTLIFTNFLRDIPEELHDAMRIDGVSKLGTLRRLVIPLSLPPIATISIYEFIVNWNSFLLPLVLTQSSDERVIPIALWSYQGQHATDFQGLMAAILLSILPLMLLFIIGKKYLVRGFTVGVGK